MKKKILIKTIIFITILIFIISLFTDVLKYKDKERVQESKEQLVSMPEDSVDVLFLGASAVYAGISPIYLWNDYGITSFNLGSSVQPPLLTYYIFEETIRYQKPEVIVIEFVSLTNEHTPDRYEAYYLRGLEGILDRKLKVEVINAIDKEFDLSSKASYLIPFLRYHHRWSELAERDFVDLNGYKPYKLGGLRDERVKSIEFSDNFMNPEEEKKVNFETSEKYYLKLIEFARENDIEIFAVSPPRTNRRYGEYLAQRDFCEKNGITYIDYSLEENFQQLNFDLEQDFYNKGHLNKYGNKKLTSHIGKYISENYAIEDKRDNNEYSYWNELYDEYIEDTEN